MQGLDLFLQYLVVRAFWGIVLLFWLLSLVAQERAQVPFQTVSASWHSFQKRQRSNPLVLASCGSPERQITSWLRTERYKPPLCCLKGAPGWSRAVHPLGTGVLMGSLYENDLYSPLALRSLPAWVEVTAVIKTSNRVFFPADHNGWNQ